MSDSLDSKKNECENTGFQFWRQTLKKARLVVAPMVDQSELPWRMLSRNYGAELCYTPMLHASLFAKDPNYRRDFMKTCPEDRPLIVQFCANDPETLLKAAQIAQEHCDAVDINLGCPQIIAKRGHYGAFLQDEWDLIHKMIKICHENLSVPVTCKIRVFPCKDKTVQYAKMIESSGCQLLTVHGRTREQKGRNTGMADWSYIKAVREAVKIPVYANGNIQYLSDIDRCIKETGVQGVMTAEGNLHNPALFHGLNPYVWDMVYEYLDYADKYPCQLSFMRGHVFKIMHHALTIHRDVREFVASGKNVEDFRHAARMLEEICQEKIKENEEDPSKYTRNFRLPLPYWICQPYVRPSEDDAKDPDHVILRQNLNTQRAEAMERLKAGDMTLSNKQLKKRLKHPHKNYDRDRKRKFTNCRQCTNPMSLKCDNELCKTCCRVECAVKVLSCKGHNFKTKHFREHEDKDSEIVKKDDINSNCDQSDVKQTDKLLMETHTEICLDVGIQKECDLNQLQYS